MGLWSARGSPHLEGSVQGILVLELPQEVIVRSELLHFWFRHHKLILGTLLVIIRTKRCGEWTSLTHRGRLVLFPPHKVAVSAPSWLLGKGQSQGLLLVGPVLD